MVQSQWFNPVDLSGMDQRDINFVGRCGVPLVIELINPNVR